MDAFHHLLLKTVLCCVACDGHIDPREIQWIRTLPGDILGDAKSPLLREMMETFNRQGMAFIQQFLLEISTQDLSPKEELTLIEVALQTIRADDKIDDREIKFFKVIRTQLKISNDQILQVHPEFDAYLEEDILSDSYLAKFHFTLPTLEFFNTDDFHD